MLNFGARLKPSGTADHGQAERINETSYKTQAQPQTYRVLAPFYVKNRKTYGKSKIGIQQPISFPSTAFVRNILCPSKY